MDAKSIAMGILATHTPQNAEELCVTIINGLKAVGRLQRGEAR